MSEVRWADQAVQQAEERRQIEKSDDEKKQTRAAFEKRLQQDRSQKEGAVKQQTADQRMRAQQQDAKGAVTKQQGADEQAATEKARGEQQKQGAKKTDKKQSGVLAHVRQQAAQQGAKGLDRRASVLGEQAAAAQREAEATAQHSQESGKTLAKGRDEGLNTGRTSEKDRTRELKDKDKVKETDKESARVESKQEAAQAQTQQNVQSAQGNAQNQAIDADQQRRNQGQGQQQGGQQQQPGQVTQTDDLKGPSAQAIKRANKAAEIQKLCEKLLDNFYLGAAPDGSAMMRMELKEGVLAGLVIDLRVDDKRRVKLGLSGPKDAVDFVTSSRGELARALSRKGLELTSVEAT
ncbi:MAG: hypothetical protein HY904_10755 [Deltaproteobacteria bacterium]|nr:hypothetical protein [Deltaproteobacteria bacterium]